MITDEQQAYLVSDYQAASMPELRAMAAQWKVVGRSKMRKPELVQTLVRIAIERSIAAEQDGVANESAAEVFEEIAAENASGVTRDVTAPLPARPKHIENERARLLQRGAELGLSEHQLLSDTDDLRALVEAAESRVPAELCAHGINAARRCSICDEDRTASRGQDMCLGDFGAYGMCVRLRGHAEAKCRDAFGHEFTAREGTRRPAEEIGTLWRPTFVQHTRSGELCEVLGFDGEYLFLQSRTLNDLYSVRPSTLRWDYRAVCEHNKGRDCWLCPAAGEAPQYWHRTYLRHEVTAQRFEVLGTQNGRVYVRHAGDAEWAFSIDANGLNHGGYVACDAPATPLSATVTVEHTDGRVPDTIEAWKAYVGRVKASRASAEADLFAAIEDRDALDEQVSALTRERDVWKRAAEGMRDAPVSLNAQLIKARDEAVTRLNALRESIAFIVGQWSVIEGKTRLKTAANVLDSILKENR